MCRGEGGTLQTNIAGMCGAGSARSVWTTQGFLKLMGACAFRVYTAQVAGCSAGYCPKWALHFLHFPGPSCSGSGFWVHRKGADSVARAFCSLPRSQQLRWSPELCICAKWALHLNHFLGPDRSVYWVCHESTISGVSWVSSGELISSYDPPGRCQQSRTPGREPAHSLVEDAVLWG